jgi:hypothetical protein
MAYIQGEGRGQGTLFPVMWDDFVPVDHVCRAIDAFVVHLDMNGLGFAGDRQKFLLLYNRKHGMIPVVNLKVISQ